MEVQNKFTSLYRTVLKFLKLSLSQGQVSVEDVEQSQVDDISEVETNFTSGAHFIEQVCKFCYELEKEKKAFEQPYNVAISAM